MARTWKCRACLTAGQPPRKRLCSACGLRRPAKRHSKHLTAKLSFEEHVARNGGDFCGICGGLQKPGGKRLHRDHDHMNGGRPRGLLCFRCNAAVRNYMTLPWAVKLVLYLSKFADPIDFDSSPTSKGK